MKTNLQIVWLLLIVGTFVTACGSSKSEESKDVVTEIIAVKTYKVGSNKRANTITATGMLSTLNEAKYAFKTGGIIDRIYVTEGEAFKKGQLLASINLTEIDAGENQAALGLEKAKRDYERVKNLYADSVATLEQLQNTKTALDLAQRQLDGVSFNRKYAQIYATHNGFVTKKLANEGEVIGAGMPVLVINESGSANWVLKAGVSDKQWAQIELGTACEVVLDAYPNEKLKGEVYRKSKAADLNSGSFLVEVKLAAQNLETALGMFGRVNIINQKENNYKSIPYDAVIEADGKNAFVFVPTKTGGVKKTPIKITSFNNENVTVLSGLEDVEEVVLTNSAFLNEDSKITLIP